MSLDHDSWCIATDGRMNKTSSPAPSCSPSLDADTSPPDYHFEYDLIDVAQASSTKNNAKAAAENAQNQESDPEAGHTFEFRLFASPARDSTANAASAKLKTKTTIRLFPTPEVSNKPISEGCFLRPARPEAHYFTWSISNSALTELRQEYAASAVSPQDVLQKASSQAWPGTSLPWRLVQIRPADAMSDSGPHPSEVSASIVPVMDGGSRRKPNKKRRIHLRKLLVARTAAAHAKVRQTETAEEKEKALREKRTAKNRKIQLKRREKERQKKAEARAAAGTDDPQLSD